MEKRVVETTSQTTIHKDNSKNKTVFIRSCNDSSAPPAPALNCVNDVVSLKYLVGRLIDFRLLSCNFALLKSRRRAFTLIEIMVIVAIIAILAVIVTPHALWMEPPQRTLQRAFIEAIDTAKSGATMRFRIDKEENIGAIVVEVYVKERINEFGGKEEGAWMAYKMQWEPTGNAWAFKPDIIYFYQDGMCTPAKIMWGKVPYNENYLLTVTGYLVETDLIF